VSVAWLSDRLALVIADLLRSSGGGSPGGYRQRKCLAISASIEDAARKYMPLK
jgi:hypothetical protein